MSLRLALAALLFTVPASAIAAQPTAVAFERRTAADGVEIGIWYPASGTPTRQRIGLYTQDVVAGSGAPKGRHPLVVISHGTGGDLSGHVDTAVALARAGFIVAALTHVGDNWRDSSRATQIETRPPALSALISYMLTDWSGHAAVDPKRIGAFGFSAGGFTVLASAGGRPDLARVADHCARHPSFFDCRLVASQSPKTVWRDTRDPRIRAIVVAAPALGFTFDRAGLASVRVPVQLWKAANDHILPAPFYADAVRTALPVRPEFHSVPGADHFDFLPPCADASVAPQICQSAAGFDRKAFHERFNAELVRFLTRTLAPSRR